MGRAVRIGGLLLSLVLLLATARASGVGSAAVYFSGSGVSEVVVSPDGEWIAARVQRGDEWEALVQRVGVAKGVRIARSRYIGRLLWDANASLLVEEASAAGIQRVVVARLSHREGAIAVDRDVIQTMGYLVDSLPYEPERVLWLFQVGRWTSLHRISIAELLDFNRLYSSSGWTVEIGDKLASVKGFASRWVIERDGTPRAALRHRATGKALMMPLAGVGPLDAVRSFEPEHPERYVVPVGLTPDERAVLVLAYKEGDTFGLYEWDSRRQDPGRSVFVHPDYDLAGVVTDPLTGELVAVSFETDAGRRLHYFDAYRARFLSKLPESWRRDSIQISSGSADRQVFVFRDGSATNPGDWYVRDRSGGVTLVGRTADDVDRTRLAAVERFRVASSAGVEIEAFLTLPRGGEGEAPLVVMPHGGPHSVRDDHAYDPFAQYLASWGYAVLQVNYRGSSGYGLEFAQLGRREWARGIEDDIDAAVERAMQHPAIDAGRLCIVGGSYGGFSALASVVRHRDRYRCAVSINGASDVPFIGESSDFADSEHSMKSWQRMVGDVESERETLLEISPAYHVDRIDAPVLVVYGTRDRRVDPDHSHRVLAMLELYGKPHEVLEIEGAEHGFHRDEWIIVARTVRRFLSEHLLPGVPFVPDP